MPQHRHAFTQLLKRQELLLIGGEHSFDAFVHLAQLPLQTLLPFPGWIRSACGGQPAIKFLLDQSWVFEQADHLGPDDLII